ncbi:MAG: response regulator [Anaerolineae bacterium]|nr:response regulator [Anaerolineae bacterium]
MEPSKQNPQTATASNIGTSPAPSYKINIKKILIVDDQADIRKLTSLMFRSTEFETCEAEGAQAALRLIHEEMPFLVLADIQMPGMSGYDLCEIIKRDPEMAHIAVIFMTAHGHTPEHVAQGLEIGGDDFIYKPFERDELLARVRVVARRKKAEIDIHSQVHALEQRNRELEMKMTLTSLPTPDIASTATAQELNLNKILIVDDQVDNRRLTSLQFRNTEFETCDADGAQTALEKVREEKPFLVLSDIQMPDIDGYELCRKIKNDPETKQTAVVFMTAHDRSAIHTAQGLEMGADDYLTKPIDPDILIARVRVVQRLKKAQADARHQMRVAEQRNRDLELLNQVSQELTSILDIKQVLDNTTRSVQQAVKAEIGSLFLLNEDGQSLVLEATSGPNAQEARGVSIQASEGIAGYVLRSGKSYLSGDVTQDEKHSDALSGKGFDTRSMLCVPLRISGRIIGVIQALHSQSDKFSQSDLKLFESVANSVSIAVQNAQFVEKISNFNEHLEGTVAERTHELEQSTRELEQEQNRTAAILANMADALVVIDAEGNIAEANLVAQRMLNFRREEVVGQPISPEWLDNELWRAINDLARNEEWTATVTVDIKDPQQTEKVLSIEARSSKILDNEGQAINTIIVLRDLTALKEVERMKARFMEGVTHDLKTPLTVIRTHASNFNIYYKRLNDNKRKELVKSIEDQVGVLERLVGDILAMVRLDSGVVLKRQDRDLVAMIDKIVTELRPLAEEKRLKLLWQKPRSPLMASLDADQMERVARNLVGNAINYTESGTIQVEVLEARIEGNPVVAIRVSDTGIGMTPEHIGDGSLSAPIFERFYRADPAHTVPGTGLGLAIVKEIVLAHGGDVHVSSEVGKGSVFFVNLPAHGG